MQGCGDYLAVSSFQRKSRARRGFGILIETGRFFVANRLSSKRLARFTVPRYRVCEGAIQVGVPGTVP